MRHLCLLEALECYHLPVLVNRSVIVISFAHLFLPYHLEGGTDVFLYVPFSGTWPVWAYSWLCSWHRWRGLFFFFTVIGIFYLYLCGFFNFTKNVQNKANPLATILSAAMLLKYGLGEEKAANRIETAVLDTLDRGFRTGDIYSVGLVWVSFLFVKYEWKAWLVPAIKCRIVQQTLVALLL